MFDRPVDVQVTVPGRSIAFVLDSFDGMLSEEQCQVLSNFHEGVLLQLQAAGKAPASDAETGVTYLIPKVLSICSV